MADSEIMNKTKRRPVVGETLYDLNIGNAARGRPQTLKPVIVRTVGRKYFSCSPEKYPGITTEYHLDTWLEKSDYCRDHQLYEGEWEWLEEIESDAISRKLRDLFSHYGKPSLTLEQLRSIDKIAFGESP